MIMGTVPQQQKQWWPRSKAASIPRLFGLKPKKSPKLDIQPPPSTAGPVRSRALTVDNSLLAKPKKPTSATTLSSTEHDDEPRTPDDATDRSYRASYQPSTLSFSTQEDPFAAVVPRNFRGALPGGPEYLDPLEKHCNRLPIRQQSSGRLRTLSELPPTPAPPPSHGLPPTPNERNRTISNASSRSRESPIVNRKWRTETPTPRSMRKSVSQQSLGVRARAESSASTAASSIISEVSVASGSSPKYGSLKSVKKQRSFHNARGIVSAPPPVPPPLSPPLRHANSFNPPSSSSLPYFTPNSSASNAFSKSSSSIPVSSNHSTRKRLFSQGDSDEWNNDVGPSSGTTPPSERSKKGHNGRGSGLGLSLALGLPSFTRPFSSGSTSLSIQSTPPTQEPIWPTRSVDQADRIGEHILPPAELLSRIDGEENETSGRFRKVSDEDDWTDISRRTSSQSTIPPRIHSYPPDQPNNSRHSANTPTQADVYSTPSTPTTPSSPTTPSASTDTQFPISSVTSSPTTSPLMRHFATPMTGIHERLSNRALSIASGPPGARLPGPSSRRSSNASNRSTPSRPSTANPILPSPTESYSARNSGSNLRARRPSAAQPLSAIPQNGTIPNGVFGIEPSRRRPSLMSQASVHDKEHTPSLRPPPRRPHTASLITTSSAPTSSNSFSPISPITPGSAISIGSFLGPGSANPRRISEVPVHPLMPPPRRAGGGSSASTKSLLDDRSSIRPSTAPSRKGITRKASFLHIHDFFDDDDDDPGEDEEEVDTEPEAVLETNHSSSSRDLGIRKDSFLELGQGKDSLDEPIHAIAF